MKALVTGASSGIGRDIARELDARGWELILTARREDRLRELAAELNKPCRIVAMDIAGADNARALYELTQNDGVELLVNNAGFGLVGDFLKTELERETAMIALNVETPHVLMKLFLRDFCAQNHGRILNVASSAAFAPGPLMATYYSTKSYLYRLSQSVAIELAQAGSEVTVSVLCPGPVDTEFNDVAGVKFGIRALDSAKVARLAVEKTLAGRTVIIPGASIRLLHVLSKLAPDRLSGAVIARNQRAKLL